MTSGVSGSVPDGPPRREITHPNDWDTLIAMFDRAKIPYLCSDKGMIFVKRGPGVMDRGIVFRFDFSPGPLREISHLCPPYLTTEDYEELQKFRREAAKSRV